MYSSQESNNPATSITVQAATAMGIKKFWATLYKINEADTQKYRNIENKDLTEQKMEVLEMAGKRHTYLPSVMHLDEKEIDDKRKMLLANDEKAYSEYEDFDLENQWLIYHNSDVIGSFYTSTDKDRKIFEEGLIIDQLNAKDYTEIFCYVQILPSYDNTFCKKAIEEQILPFIRKPGKNIEIMIKIAGNKEDYSPLITNDDEKETQNWGKFEKQKQSSVERGGQGLFK